MSRKIDAALRAASLGVYLEPTWSFVDQFEHCAARNLGHDVNRDSAREHEAPEPTNEGQRRITAF